MHHLPNSQSAAAPTSVLPLFMRYGAPSQTPSSCDLTCSTCHDPSYPVNGKDSFLRIGSTEDTTNL